MPPTDSVMGWECPALVLMRRASPAAWWGFFMVAVSAVCALEVRAPGYAAHWD